MMLSSKKAAQTTDTNALRTNHTTDHDLHQKQLAENLTYRSVQQYRANQTKIANDVYARDLMHAKSILDASKHGALQRYEQHNKPQIDALHAEALQAHNRAAQERSVLFQTPLHVDSYRMMASKIGLNDVTSDVCSYVSEWSVYNSLQPLVSDKDFCARLHAESHDMHSPLIADFYNVDHVSECVDVTALQHAVRALDLSTQAVFFTHHCRFEKPTQALERHTLYVVIEHDTIQCEVLHPYGDVLSQHYHDTDKLKGQCLGFYRKDGVAMLRQWIVEHTLDFVDDMYKRARLFGFDAFSYQMTWVDGFKEHVYAVMTKHNRALAQRHGWDSIPLTKIHLYHAIRLEQGSALDQTPWGIALKTCNEKQAHVRKTYHEACAQLTKERDTAIADATLVYENACAVARHHYHEALDAIESETDFDLICADMTVQLQQFQHDENLLLPVVKQDSPMKQTALHQPSAKTLPFFMGKKSLIEGNSLTVKPINRVIYSIKENELYEDDLEVASFTLF